MKWMWTELLVILTALLPKMVWAQDLSLSETSSVTPYAGQHPILAAFVIIGATMLVILAIGKVNDFVVKRKQQVVEIEGRINDALLGHVAFLRTPVAPTVRVPFWKGSPITIVMHGRVASSELAQLALRFATEAAARVRRDARIENHLTVGPASGTPVVGTKGESHMAGRLVSNLKTLGPIVGVMAGVVLIKLAFVVEHFSFR